MSRMFASRAMVLAGVLAVGMGAAASRGASVMTYSVGAGSSVSALSTDPGLVIQTRTVIPTELMSPGGGFALNDGESYTFDFFHIWTDENDVNADDLSPKTITATLDFDSPVDAGVSVGGQTRGKLLITGTLQSGGQVTWSGPAEYVGADGLDFRVTLSNAVFNLGRPLHIGETTWGEAYGATVQATVYQVSSPAAETGDGPALPAAVPAPASAMGGGVLAAALGVWRRVKRGK